MQNSTVASPIVEIKPSGPKTLDRLVLTPSETDPSIRNLLIEMKNEQPVYPSVGKKGIIEHYAEVTPHDIRGGGDLIDVTHYLSKDWEHRKSIARKIGKRRIIEKIDSYSKRIGFSIMDVEGKGPAALRTALLVNRLMKAHNNRDLDELGEVTPRAIDYLNDDVCQDKRKTAFMYGEIIELDKPRKDGTVGIGKFISAGGLLPKIYRAARDKFDQDVAKQWTPGWLLGVARSGELPDNRKYVRDSQSKEPYIVNEFGLYPGDIAMFFTDGYRESGSTGSLVYPISKTESILRQNKSSSLTHIYDALIDDRMSDESVSINDDLGILLIRCTSKTA